MAYEKPQLNCFAKKVAPFEQLVKLVDVIQCRGGIRALSRTVIVRLLPTYVKVT